MENKTYVIYGIIEPYSKDIVYIDLYTLEIDHLEYIKNEDYINNSISIMRLKGREYWRDLYTMNKLYSDEDKDRINVVILDRWAEEEIDFDKIEDKLNYWRNLFKPRYNIGEYEKDKCSETDRYIKNGWLKYNGKEWVFTSPELENMWYGVDEDKE